MADPGSGTVTFLFTDIEGSTRLWEDHPDAMPEALAQHDAILSDAVDSAGGHVVKTTGDGVFAVFGRADAALMARWRRSGPSTLPFGVRLVRCWCGWGCTPGMPSFARAIITARR